MKPKPNLLGFFLVLFAAGIRALVAQNIGDFDEVWKERADVARKAALKAYHPFPHDVGDELNELVNTVAEKNSTRRNLRSYKGKCIATNPIDRCWRCEVDWARHRKKLAKCAKGFGRKATGGKNGRIYVVTDPSDDPLNPQKGTLRWGVVQEKPLWIIFARSMIITLEEELIVTSDKTIDGRGANVHIAYGAGITIQFVRNVIIHGLHFHDIVPKSGGMVMDSLSHIGFRTRSDGDAVSIFGSANLWIDHNSFANCADGLIDVIEGSTAITISNNHLTDHNDVILLGGNAFHWQDSIMQVTLAFNHFGRGLIQRMPRCRWGFIHVVNNDYTHWLMYAIGGSQHPTIISQGNRFIAPHNDSCKKVTKRIQTTPSVWKKWTWTSENDLLVNGARFIESGTPRKKFSNVSKKSLIKPKPGTFVQRLTRYAGALPCKKGIPC